jgi:exo-beta-1,3-glucanase (GH17 family)
MKAAAFALAAGSLMSSVVASPHDRHMDVHNRRAQDVAPFPIVPKNEESCGCTTYTTWVTVGPGGLYTPPAPPATHPTTSQSTVYVSPSPLPTSSSSTPCTVPTPVETSYSATGTYTVTGTSTITLTTTHTAPSPTSTVCEGTCSYGGVTTSVTTETVVTCPYATTSVTGGITTSVVTSTTYTCPSGGEYTIIPHTTVTATTPSTISYPTTTTYPPGTYTQPTTTITVTKTEETFTCPYESVTPPAPTHTESPTSKYTPPAPTTTYVPPPAYTTSKETPPPAPTTTKEVPPPETETYSPPEYTTTSPKPKPTHETPPPYSGGSTNGNQWAMTYTPYGSTGGCKTAGQVMSDIASIKAMGFTTVRTYSTDCSTLEFVGNACKASGMKMIIGIFIDETGLSGAQSQLSDIMSWAQWDLVESCVVGNEAIFNGYTTAGELAGFITEVKGKLQGAGCSVPVTTTEPVNIMQEYGSALCGAMDILGVNIQPYFDANTSPSSAGEFVVSQMALAQKVCPDLDVYNFECGWPHSGSANGAAVAGTSQQHEAISAIVAAAGKKTCIFSFGDDMWKSSGEFGVEQFFGASTCF